MNILFWTSWRAQLLCISIYLRAVRRRDSSLLTKRIVYRLSHQIFSWSASSNLIPANRCSVAIASLATAVRASNSALVDEVVIVSCLPDFQAIGPPKRVIRCL